MTVLEKRSLHKQVAHLLARRILSGDLQPGSQIPGMDALRDEFSVSRTVLREAIKLLTAKGLVRSRPRVGITVRPRSDWSLLDPELIMWRVDADFGWDFFNDLIGMRRIIEPGAAEQAALHASPQEVDLLQARYRRLEAAVDDQQAFVSADVQYHIGIIAATHNEMIQPLRVPIGVAILALAGCTATVPGTAETALPLHRAVIDAISRHDPLEANQTMRELLADTAIAVEQFLAQADKDSQLFDCASEGIAMFLNEIGDEHQYETDSLL